VVGADFDSGTGLWTVTTRQGGTGQVTFTSRFLFLGTGYYDIDRGFTPLFAGVDDFEGRVVHPQQWPEDLDYTGKRVVVIGSGATAVTLVPSMAGAAGHVTMLQRSPGYVFSIPAEDRVANVLNTVLGPPRAHGVIRRKNIAFARALFKACRRSPKLMRRLLIANVRRQLPRHFDVDTHFTPRYLPWEQRLCMVPDGDLFRALSAGTASVVTGRIERFTKAGILLESGQEIAADIVVTATGLTMHPFGKVRIAVDGMPVDVGERFSFKAMMLAGVPNLAYALGYTNISWTLKVDLVADHFCRLLEHMRDNGYDMFEPVLDDPHMERLPLMDLKAGYVQRGIDRSPSPALEVHGASSTPTSSMSRACATVP
jgi:cation diffusion facilitator CzcD-associated flavoprotein CzcO